MMARVEGKSQSVTRLVRSQSAPLTEQTLLLLTVQATGYSMKQSAHYVRYSSGTGSSVALQSLSDLTLTELNSVSELHHLHRHVATYWLITTVQCEAPTEGDRT